MFIVEDKIAEFLSKANYGSNSLVTWSPFTELNYFFTPGERNKWSLLGKFISYTKIKMLSGTHTTKEWIRSPFTAVVQVNLSFV